MSMSAFRIPIMFRSVGSSSEMGYIMGRKERLKSWEFNGGCEIIFNKLLEGQAEEDRGRAED